MRIIYARNVNDAWPQAIRYMDEVGEPEPSRVGPVRVAPHPVVTIYSKPMERVLFDPVRDANPIFHLHEALWMLAGSNDATWLDQFVSDFSSRYAEEGGTMHGAYGHRWREHFDFDQLDSVVRILQKEPTSRQAVIQMWDVQADLEIPGLKDRPCNTQIYLRIRNGALDLCTTVRSNDIVWGAYGANAVHFTILQEYLAARIGVFIGTFTQFSWNWHMYDNARHLVSPESAASVGEYPYPDHIVTNSDTFDQEVRDYIDDPMSAHEAKNTFLLDTAYYMLVANDLRKQKLWDSAIRTAEAIKAPDWREATLMWLKRRKK
jgi:thymidylate synthase